MVFPPYFRTWKYTLTRRTLKRPHQVRRTSRPPRQMSIELLEDRTLLNAGALDPTFGMGGKVTTDFGLVTSGTDMAQAVQVIQPDGKVLVVGQSAYSNSNSDVEVVRLN